MPDPADLPPDALAYGRLAIATLAGVTLGSSAALTVALAVVLSAPHLRPGIPYGDLPWALLAIGGAASLACLASAAAYAGRVALARGLAARGRRLRGATTLLMTAAYLAFAVGGGAFACFCVAAAAALT